MPWCVLNAATAVSESKTSPWHHRLGRKWSRWCPAAQLWQRGGQLEGIEYGGWKILLHIIGDVMGVYHQMPIPRGAIWKWPLSGLKWPLSGLSDLLGFWLSDLFVTNGRSLGEKHQKRSEGIVWFMIFHDKCFSLTVLCLLFQLNCAVLCLLTVLNNNFPY